LLFKNRSVFQILGADQADRLRGTNPLGNHIAADGTILALNQRPSSTTR
jgi:hypothetical protein